MNRKHLLSLAAIALTACSSVDSTKPFDQQQAAYLIKQSRALRPAQQRIALNLPTHDWQRVDLSLGTYGTPIMLIPKHATANDWDQSIRTKVLAFAEERNATPASFSQQLIATAKTACQHVEEQTLTSRPDTVVYRLTLAGCRDEKNQTQIAKAIRGKDAIYLVYYSATDAVSSTDIKRYTRTIEQAQLVSDPRS